jgi:hypothetical protein
VVVENPPPAPSLTGDAEPGAILVEMRAARIQIGANAQSAVIAATLKALRF